MMALTWHTNQRENSVGKTPNGPQTNWRKCESPGVVPLTRAQLSSYIQGSTRRSARSEACEER